ncbi:MAG: recombinase family protein [Halodesulfurarchaeum sp.]
MPRFDSTAIYVRQSTKDQSSEHQLDDIREWLDRHDLGIGDVDVYAEQASGASADRDEFTDLVDDIETGHVTDVVVWEISRLARKGTLAQEFFDACENSEVVIHVTNGSVREIHPDGTGRLIADIIASVAAEERRNLIRRTKSGIKRARKEGKWVGQVPAGFIRVDGYLKPNMDPDYEEGETGYLDIAEALERLDDGDSYRAVAANTPNISRPGLMNIDKDDERRRWYLEAESDDDRVAEAVESVRTENTV